MLFKRLLGHGKAKVRSTGGADKASVAAADRPVTASRWLWGALHAIGDLTSGCCHGPPPPPELAGGLLRGRLLPCGGPSYRGSACGGCALASRRCVPAAAAAACTQSPPACQCPHMTLCYAAPRPDVAWGAAFDLCPACNARYIHVVDEHGGGAAAAANAGGPTGDSFGTGHDLAQTSSARQVPAGRTASFKAIRQVLQVGVRLNPQGTYGGAPRLDPAAPGHTRAHAAAPAGSAAYRAPCLLMSDDGLPCHHVHGVCCQSSRPMQFSSHMHINAHQCAQNLGGSGSSSGSKELHLQSAASGQQRLAGFLKGQVGCSEVTFVSTADEGAACMHAPHACMRLPGASSRTCAGTHA